MTSNQDDQNATSTAVLPRRALNALLALSLAMLLMVGVAVFGLGQWGPEATKEVVSVEVEKGGVETPEKHLAKVTACPKNILPGKGQAKGFCRAMVSQDSRC